MIALKTWVPDAALTGRQRSSQRRRADSQHTIIASINRRTAKEQRVRLCRAAIVLKRAQPRVDWQGECAHLIAVCAVGESGAAIADPDQVVTLAIERTEHIRMIDSDASDAVARNDRVPHIHCARIVANAAGFIAGAISSERRVYYRDSGRPRVPIIHQTAA